MRLFKSPEEKARAAERKKRRIAREQDLGDAMADAKDLYAKAYVKSLGPAMRKVAKTKATEDAKEIVAGNIKIPGLQGPSQTGTGKSKGMKILEALSKGGGNFLDNTGMGNQGAGLKLGNPLDQLGMGTPAPGPKVTYRNPLEEDLMAQPGSKNPAKKGKKRTYVSWIDDPDKRDAVF